MSSGPRIGSPSGGRIPRRKGSSEALRLAASAERLEEQVKALAVGVGPEEITVIREALSRLQTALNGAAATAARLSEVECETRTETRSDLDWRAVAATATTRLRAPDDDADAPGETPGTWSEY